MTLMLAWLSSNIGTIIVAVILAAVVGFVIARMAVDKKRGKSICGGNCAACALHGECHKK